VAKDPEQYPSMVREFVVPALPDLGSRLGGRDYWLARGGDGLSRALLAPDSRGSQRGLGYLWGYPTAELTVEVREPRDFRLSLYFVDWDRQHRRQLVTLEDAGGTRRLDLDRDFSEGLWAGWEVTATPEVPVRVKLEQKGHDTAVLSAAAFDRPRGARRAAPDLDERTAGNWRGVYGAEGYALFAFHSFNVDAASLPPYVTRYELTHVGDKDDPRIHVEIAQQDLLDTPMLYAAPFSPLLGNAWLLAADAARLLAPARPDLVGAVLARPPWTWFGIAAPMPEHPEYGLGLDFWPTLLYTNYASHSSVLTAMWLALAVVEVGLLVALGGLSHALALSPRITSGTLLVLVACLVFFNALQVRA
jgi:hypothetical protein